MLMIRNLLAVGCLFLLGLSLVAARSAVGFGTRVRAAAIPGCPADARRGRPVPRYNQDRLKRAAKRERLGCLRGRCLRPAVGAISRRRLLTCKLAGNAPNDAF